MRFLFALLGFVAGLAAAFAMLGMPQSNAAADGATIEDFTAANVSSVLTEVGATIDSSGTTPDGRPYVRFLHNGRKYTAHMHVCTGDKCKGLQLGAAFEGGNFPLKAVNDYNMLAFAKAVVLPGGQLFSVRYAISDGGISRANVVSEVNNFFGVTDTLVVHMRNAEIVAQRQTGIGEVAYRAPRAGAPAGRSTHAAVVGDMQSAPANPF